MFGQLCFYPFSAIFQILPFTMRVPVEASHRDYPPITPYHETQEESFRAEALKSGEIWFHATTKNGWANGQLEAVHALDILQQVKKNNRLPGNPTIIRLKEKLCHYPSWQWMYNGLGDDYAAMELRWGEHDTELPYGPIGVRIYADNHIGRGIGAGFTGDNWTRVNKSDDYHNYRRFLVTQRRIGDVRDLLLRRQIDIAMGLATPDKYHGREAYTVWELVNPPIVRAV